MAARAGASWAAGESAVRCVISRCVTRAVTAQRRAFHFLIGCVHLIQSDAATRQSATINLVF